MQARGRETSATKTSELTARGGAPLQPQTQVATGLSLPEQLFNRVTELFSYWCMVHLTHGRKAGRSASSLLQPRIRSNTVQRAQEARMGLWAVWTRPPSCCEGSPVQFKVSSRSLMLYGDSCKSSGRRFRSDTSSRDRRNSWPAASATIPISPAATQHLPVSHIHFPAMLARS
jgi:hypothetical protein